MTPSVNPVTEAKELLRQHHAEECFPLKMAEAYGADDFVVGFDAKVKIFEKTERHQIAHD